MSPLLDEALATLGEKDRQAVLLRFFENKSLAEVGNALGAGEDTARKRVSRALEKLHRYFAKRGVTSTTATIAGKISANSIQVAPAALAKSVTAVAIAKGAAASASTLTLIKGALKIMAWTKVKTAIVVAACVLLTTGTTTVIVKNLNQPNVTNEMWMVDWESIKKLPPVLVLRPSQFPNQPMGMMSEGKYVYRNQLFGLIFNIAYPAPGAARSVHSDLLPSPRYDWNKATAPKLTNGFDLMLTLTNHPVEKLREEIKRQFGLAAHTEAMETNVFLLKVKHYPSSGLTPGDKTTHRFDINGFMDYGYAMTNSEGLGNFAAWLESVFQIPVVDTTNLKDVYNVSLQYDPEELLRGMTAQGFDKRRQVEQELVRKALLDQLGLELVPSRESIEMLVVEKVK